MARDKTHPRVCPWAKVRCSLGSNPVGVSFGLPWLLGWGLGALPLPITSDIPSLYKGICDELQPSTHCLPESLACSILGYTKLKFQDLLTSQEKAGLVQNGRYF